MKLLLACLLSLLVALATCSDEGVEAPVLAAILQENDAALKAALEQGADANIVVGGWSPLHAAASRGNVAWIELLLAHGATPDARNLNGRSCLFEAVSERQLPVLQVLLEAKADVNQVDNRGQSPLQLASTLGDEAIVAALLAAGAQVSTRNELGATPLFYAVAFGHSEVVNSLLEAGADPNVESKDGLTPLFEAAVAGHEDLVRTFLDLGASPNQRSITGWTPLHNAAKSGSLEITRMLLEHGAVVDAVEDQESRTPLFLACVEGSTYIARLLLEAKADLELAATGHMTPLMAATVRGHQAVVELLLEYGANVNTRSDEGLNALVQAVTASNDQLTHLLLQAGADTNVGDYQKRFFPLILAAARGSLAVVKDLVDHGADVRLVSLQRTSAAHAAAMEGHTDVLAFLLKQGLDPNTVDAKGWSSLHNAIHGGHVDTVALLLDHGVSPNLSHNGVLPVTLAGILKHSAVVSLLAERGADLNLADKEGWTPLLHLCGAGAADAVATILRHGASVNARNSNGQGAIQVAQARGHNGEIVSLLAKAGADLDDLDVAQWLESVGFGHLAESFAEHSITGSVLPHLTREVLKSELGISKVGPLVKLSAALAPLRRPTRDEL